MPNSESVHSFGIGKMNRSQSGDYELWKDGSQTEPNNSEERVSFESATNKNDSLRSICDA